MTSDTVLLIPGLMCDATVWRHQIEALSGAAPCRVADHGMLDSIPAMASQLLASTPEPRFSVVGHSMGGRVALEIVRQAPERVRRLALLDTGYQPLPDGEAGEQERAGRMRLLAQGREHGMREMARTWARGMVHPDAVDTPVFEAIVDMVAHNSPERFAAQARALLDRPNAESLLARIECPTLIACGRQDAWSPLARHEVMAARIPRATLAVIEDAGHMSTMEQPAQVSRWLAQWLSVPA